MEALSYFVVRLGMKPRQIIGPLNLSTLRDELNAGTFRWDDLVWNSTEVDEKWYRLHELNEAKPFMNPLPEPERLQKYVRICKDSLGKNTPEAETKPEITQTAAIHVPQLIAPIYLQEKGREHGPFDVNSLQAFLKKTIFKDQLYIWYQGFRTWFPIQEVPGFSHLKFETSAMAKLSSEAMEKVIFSREERGSIRRSWVATVHFSGGIPSGICVDISISGMQVRLENYYSFQLKEEIEGTIIPISLLGIPALTFKAKVMWFKKEELKLGLVFTSMDDQARDRLEQHLADVGYKMAQRQLLK